MSNDLSTPLKGVKGKTGLVRHLPWARTLFVVIALLGGAFALRLLLVEDPNGGRPGTEVAITSTRNANDLATEVATGPVTITADPQQFPAGTSMTAVPTGTVTGPGSFEGVPDMFGALPDLIEPTAEGNIPRMSATGQTPFAAYARTSTASAGPTVAIVVTGLGINEQGSLDAVDALPDDVTLAFAPYGNSLQSTVAAARMAGHEVLLEIPLEPFDFPQNDPGPQTLLTGEAPRANLDKLFWLMARFGGYVGVINNMGARFTASAADFAPIMEELGARGLGYLDDGSSSRSVAPQLADANSVPFARAQMVLDENPSRDAIMTALEQLESEALANGGAIGIISALPISIATVSEWTAGLEAKGLSLAPASALMQ
jgi:polysaccharide deacetylase 2 family uncharacterized protein YibQ